MMMSGDEIEISDSTADLLNAIANAESDPFVLAARAEIDPEEFRRFMVECGEDSHEAIQLLTAAELRESLKPEGAQKHSQTALQDQLATRLPSLLSGSAISAENRTKTCTAETDLALVSRYQNGDEQALNDLFQSHEGLMMFWARKVGSLADRDDVMQEARIGFMKAAQKFDVSRTDNFHAYARTMVMRGILESATIRRVNRTLYSHYREVQLAQDKLIQELERMPTLKEVSEATQLPIKQVENSLNVIAAFPVPLEAIDDRLAIEESSQIEAAYQSELITDAIDKLNPDQQEVIVRSYMYGQTPAEIASSLGKSEAAIKLARRRALTKLRNIISGGEVRK
jgi:RNA polymerase sigma factor (sigma-70 family)